MCGGSGSRLWPKSRNLLPKQFLKLDNYESIDVKKEIKELFIYHFREKLRELTVMETSETSDKFEEK